MSAPWTLAEVEAKIAAFEAALDDLALLPTRGSTGKTSLDLSGKAREIQDRLDTWRERREALINGEAASYRERGC